MALLAPTELLRCPRNSLPLSSPVIKNLVIASALTGLPQRQVLTVFWFFFLFASLCLYNLAAFFLYLFSIETFYLTWLLHFSRPAYVVVFGTPNTVNCRLT